MSKQIKEKIRIEIDYEKAEKVLSQLMGLEQKRAFPFSLVSARPLQFLYLPNEESMPRGSREHALFLFTTCYYMRGGVKSDVIFRDFSRLYEKYPQYFLPEFFVGKNTEASAQLIIQMLRPMYSLRYNLVQIANFWVLNFLKLAKFYGGDPRNIFKFKKISYDKLLKRVKNSGKIKTDNQLGFYGFREKMTSMLSYFFVEAGLVPNFLFSIPVDFHVMRVFLQQKILTAYEGDKLAEEIPIDPVRKEAMKVAVDFTRRHSIDPIKLCDAVWGFSRALCSLNPLNSTHKGEYKGRKTPIWFIFDQKGWTHGVIKSYRNSCGSCPVFETCELNVGAGIYYTRAIFLARKPVLPPQVELRFE